MKTLQNKYQDYTQIVQFDRKIMFYQGKMFYNIYDVQNRELERIPIKIAEKGKTPKAFSTAIHYKEQCKIGQQIESLMIFSFHQVEKNSNK